VESKFPYYIVRFKQTICDEKRVEV